ncbi:hypothetical protein CYMTET_7304 [Cymbomonas tetramitiformis]|uniref:EF-hand domain-containing protein n=1 Tax=Cymbomonas tetramitiformis TaxID=36881 RepID=A0AAE0LH08_9CHLO|nr:hypothetical protein CYMTET_7304 [Cymbomonas tetramitiformis]
MTVKKSAQTVDQSSTVNVHFPAEADPILRTVGPVIQFSQMQASLGWHETKEEARLAFGPQGLMPVPRSLTTSLFVNSTNRQSPTTILQILFQNETCYLDDQNFPAYQNHVWVKWVHATPVIADRQINFDVVCATDRELRGMFADRAVRMGNAPQLRRLLQDASGTGIEQMAALEQDFNIFDIDINGEISVDDMQAVAQKIFQNPESAFSDSLLIEALSKVNELAGNVIEGSPGGLSFKLFVELVFGYAKTGGDLTTISDKTFNYLDYNDDKVVTSDDLQAHLVSYGAYWINEVEFAGEAIASVANSMIEDIDTTNTGGFTITQFQSFWYENYNQIADNIAYVETAVATYIQ